jgi:hypothetical protein
MHLKCKYSHLHVNTAMHQNFDKVNSIFFNQLTFANPCFEYLP